MKSRLEEDLRIGDLEGLIMDKFQVDSFQPKFCDEKDVAVVSFLVSQRESAAALSDYITQGPFNFLNVEASASPDEGGSYVVLAELDRSQEMFNTIDQLLRYIDRQVHIRNWYFKPYASEAHIPWNKDNFVKHVPQNPQEFQFGKNGDSKDKKPTSESARQKTAVPKTAQKAREKSADAVNYSLLARIVEREISKSSRSYFVEFQKQFRKVNKDNRRLFHHFREIKTDHQHLVKQLDLHQRREKLALMREQQDIKRIRDLEDRLTYLLFTGPEKREIAVTDASTSPIAIEPADVLDGEDDAQEFVQTESIGAKQAPDTRPSDMGGSASDEAVIEEAEILQPEDKASDLPTGVEETEAAVQTDTEFGEAAGAAGEGAEGLRQPDEPISPLDDSPVGTTFRQAMEASKQKDYPKAIEYFTRITELSPEEPRAFYNLAILHYRLADYEKAAQCAHAAIDLGADAARKILDRVAARTSAKAERKAASRQPGGIEDDKSPETDGSLSQRRQSDSRYRPAEGPLSVFEEQTVEINGPSFAAPAAPNGETIQPAEATAESQTADTETLKEEGLPSFGDTGADDTIVIDPESLPAVEADNETTADTETAELQESQIEEILPSDSPEATVSAEPFDIENLPTAALDDFIQKESDKQQLPGEESVVEALPVEEPPAAEATVEEPTTADGKAETKAEAVEAPVEQAAAAEPQAADETAVVEEPPEAAQATAEVEELPESANVEAASEAPTETGDDAAAGADQLKAAEKPADAAVPDLQPEKAPPVVDMDLFTRGLTASKKKNYAEALQHFTEFVEKNPTQPRGYYNLAVLHYRLKDFETARDMAQRALDMGIGAAQKVYEKSQIRIAKERSVSVDIDESAATDTIFEELDTAAFETIDPGSLEEIVAAEQEIQPPTAVEIPEEGSPAVEIANAPVTDGQDTAIELSEVVAADPLTAQDPLSEAVPEFPVLTGEIAQEAGAATDGGLNGTAEEELPEIEVVPIPEPTTGKEGLPEAAEKSETAAPPLPAEPQPPEPAVKPPASASLESEKAALKVDKKKKEMPVQPEVDLGQTSTLQTEKATPKVGEQKKEMPALTPSEEVRSAKPKADTGKADALQTGKSAPKIGEDKEKKPVRMPPENVQPTQPGADPDKTSEALFAKGMKAYADKNFDGAIELFNRFISLRPSEPRGYYNLAIVCYRKKDYAAAKENAEKAAKLGAGGAKKILRKINRKRAKTGEPLSGPVATGKKRKAKPPAGDKRKKVAPAPPKGKIEPAETPEPAGAGSISTPEPLESPAAEATLGDISDYDTATFDIAEVLGHDPVVWDADDMEEEVDTSEIQSPLIGGETADDVIVFDSAAPTEPAAPPGAALSPTATDSPGTDAPKDQTGNDADQKQKVRAGGEIPGSDAFSLGLAASEKKEYLKAIRYFKKFTELSPQDPRGYYNLAVVSYRLKSYETAQEHAKQAFRLGSKPAAKILKKLKKMKAAA
jgi:tetratricopeptide (TPR) repeat protein